MPPWKRTFVRSGRSTDGFIAIETVASIALLVPIVVLGAENADTSHAVAWWPNAARNHTIVVL